MSLSSFLACLSLPEGFSFLYLRKFSTMNQTQLSPLSSAQSLAQLGINEAIQQTLLNTIPTTETVNPAKADDLWARRKRTKLCLLAYKACA